MKKFLLGMSGLLLATGCATITRGSSQAWTVETDPVGADIHLSTGESCTSPCTLQKKRKHPFTVNITKAGYEPVQTQVESTVSGAGAAGMAGNVLVGGLIGLGVDAGTGANKDLRPNPLIVKLNPQSSQPSAAAASPVAAAPDGTATGAAAPAMVETPVGVEGQ